LLIIDEIEPFLNSIGIIYQQLTKEDIKNLLERYRLIEWWKKLKNMDYYTFNIIGV
jgi:hypothetical protein